MTMPKKIVCYEYYGWAYYFDGELKYYINNGFTQCGLFELCEALGIEFSERHVRWEAMPMTSDKLHEPPQSLAFLEAHLNKLDLKNKREELKGLQERIVKLKEEISLESFGG